MAEVRSLLADAVGVGHVLAPGDFPPDYGHDESLTRLVLELKVPPPGPGAPSGLGLRPPRARRLLSLIHI